MNKTYGEAVKMTTAIQRQLGSDFMTGVPEEAYEDYRLIANSIMNGLSFNEICEKTNLNNYPEAREWLKNAWFYHSSGGRGA